MHLKIKKTIESARCWIPSVLSKGLFFSSEYIFSENWTILFGYTVPIAATMPFCSTGGKLLARWSCWTCAMRRIWKIKFMVEVKIRKYFGCWIRNRNFFTGTGFNLYQINWSNICNDLKKNLRIFKITKYISLLRYN